MTAQDKLDWQRPLSELSRERINELIKADIEAKIREHSRKEVDEYLEFLRQKEAEKAQ